MSSRFLKISGAAAIAAMLVLSSPAFAQSDGADMEMRIQRLENQLRQLTGQNEELQYRNRLLEERLRQLGGAPEAAQPQAAQAPVAPPSVAAMPPAQPNPPLGSRSRVIRPRSPVMDNRRSQPRRPSCRSPPSRTAPRRCVRPQPESERSRCTAPAWRRSAPDIERSTVGAPGGRGAGEPLDLGATSPRGSGAGTGLTTLPPSATPKDEFDLGIGYMQRKDYALAEETMKNFAQKYPSDRLIADFAILARRELLPAPAIS